MTQQQLGFASRAGLSSLPTHLAAAAAVPTAAQPPTQRLPARLAPYEPLLQRIATAHSVTADDVAYTDLAVQVWMRPGFDTFVSLPRLHFEPFAHQLGAAAAALRRMRGRAILADEVGLGKTIEALLVLSELRLRGLAENVLVLVPAGLVGQWQEELDRKFGLPSRVAAGAIDAAATDEVLLASIATARRAPMRDAVTERRWDLVIVDEAHRARNPQSASGALIRGLQSRCLLLLTATPVENRLDDVFHLVNVVKPGQLGSIQEFRSRHGTGTAGVRDTAELQRRMRDVMVRHRRSEVEVMLPRRLAETRVVAARQDEIELYRDVSNAVREQARSAGPTARLSLQTLQRIAGSSPAALVPALERAGWRALAERARVIAPAEKARVLLDLLQRRSLEATKVIVFTSFTATLDRLAELVRAAGMDAAVYHGALSRRQKDDAIRRFQQDVDLLLSSEAGGEGRNLQFCHSMVNFDVPWNPMQIEQRLGRIHRIGQEHEVTLTNLVTRGTIEERILRILERKINLFELVVGELDMILGRVQEEGDFAARVFDAHVSSGGDDELEGRLQALGDTLLSARDQYRESRERTDMLIGELE